MISPSKLALGTAQFGSAYGIANTTGQMTPEAILAVLATAHAAGLDTLDTAIAYGDSETRLGRAGVRGWNIITKLPALPPGADPSAWVHAQVEDSLQRLGVDALAGLLLHRPGQLLEAGGPSLWAALEQQKDQGRVRLIGISIYHPAELDTLWPAFHPELVQAPLNLFDQRLLSSGWMDRMASSGTEVHTRSAFLQGLLLLPSTRRPAWCARWSKLFERWDQWLEKTGCSPESAALAWVFHQPGIARVVVGVDQPAQLQRLLDLIQGPEWSTLPLDNLESFAQSDEALLNPAQWPRP